MDQSPRPKWKVFRWILRLLIAIFVLWAVAGLVLYFWVIFLRGHFD